MLKQLAQLEYKIGERVYQFVCDPNSPLAECKTALQEFTAYADMMLVQWEKAAEALKESQEKEEKKEEVTNG